MATKEDFSNILILVYALLDRLEAEARIEASKAKAARFASFLKAEREKNKSDPKFTKDANLVIKPSNLYVESKVTSLLQEDSTPATKLGVNSKEVESVGVMPSKVEVESVELCSEKDSTPATTLQDNSKEVE